MKATKINAYNVYNKGKKQAGVSDEVTLPDFEALTETISGPGFLGKIDEPLLGHFGASEMEIPFRTLNEEMFDLLAAGNAVDLTLRMSTQAIVESPRLRRTFYPAGWSFAARARALPAAKLSREKEPAPALR